MGMIKLASLTKLNQLQVFAEYFSINWLDGEWTVFIEKVNGRRVDAVSDLPSTSLDHAIESAMSEAKKKLALGS